MKSSKKSAVRLTNAVTPIRYKLTLHPDLDAHTFAGEETIDIVLAKSLKDITLHSKDLDIASAAIIVGKVKTIAAKISYDDKKETATFTFAKAIPKGKAKLALSFRGILSDTLRGFYKSRYMHEGKEHIMATTQFEATDARRAFPCFDEPAYKAVFDVSLVVLTNKTAISNTLPIVTREHSPGFQMIDFAPTPKMSTYLLAFIIGDFEYVEKKTKSGVKVRVYTTPGKKAQAAFALDTSVRCLEFYESYFGIKYPLDTLDAIAIPDFETAAMENWGAVTYRESCLLVDDEHTSLSTKQWAAIVICHELAHQWFGNLVTMEWWTDLWLNEGFASYIEYLAADTLFPEWKLWEQFVAIDHAIALRLDALETTHPIEIPVHDPSEIGEIFDEISYQKGAAVIRMLATYLGQETFRKGLSSYLKKHSYKNTTTVDLWDAFEKASKKPVKKMMEVWTKKPGHPVVSVTEKHTKLHFSQTHYFRSPISKKKSKDMTTWPIPLTFFTGSETKIKDAYFSKKNLVLPRGSAPWIKVNADETGVYRVKYDVHLLRALRKPIEEKLLTAEDRLGIVRDLFALSEAGEMPVVDVLEFLTSYEGETSYIVWSEILTGLSRIKNLFARESWIEGFSAYARTLLAPIVRHVGFEKKKDEVHSDTLLRSLVLGAGSFYSIPSVISHAKKMWKAGTIHPDIRGFVYATHARHGSKKEFGLLLKRYRSEVLHEEKNRIAGALTHFRDRDLLQETLTFALSPDVRLQDTPSIVYGVFANTHGRDIAWAFTKKNWKGILERYGGGGHSLSRFIKPLAFFSDEKIARDAEIFFKKHAHPGGERTLSQSLEAIRANEVWKKKEKESMRKFCRRYL